MDMRLIVIPMILSVLVPVLWCMPSTEDRIRARIEELVTEFNRRFPHNPLRIIEVEGGGEMSFRVYNAGLIILEVKIAADHRLSVATPNQKDKEPVLFEKNPTRRFFYRIEDALSDQAA